jgi:hypothetical protein
MKHVVVILVVCSCGGTKLGGSGGDGGAGGHLPDVDAATTGTGGSGGSGGGGGSDGCSERAKLIYVVDANNTLASFDPMSLTFTNIGTLGCPSSALVTPMGMTIGRDATAWVSYTDGSLYRVDTTNASCTASGFTPNQQGFEVFAMGYSSDAPGSSAETLYIVGGGLLDVGMGNAQFGKLLMPQMTVQTIGSVAGWPDPTGTPLAELWGFYPDTTPPRVAKIDPASGQERANFPLPQLAGQQAQDWACKYWGAAFWIFLHRINEPSTSVYRVDAQTGMLETKLSNTGRRIVGAGVSTCAPIVGIAR